MDLVPGLVAEIRREVTLELTAQRVGSGDIPVLATPVVVALMEEASVAAIRDALANGQTTVGARVDVAHLVPSPVGSTVVAKSRLRAADGRKLDFDCEVFQGSTIVAKASHRRVIVDRAEFLASLKP